MKVAIAIPTYNRAYCLAHAVKSALDQNYHDFSVIVVDDGSDDETRELVSQWFSNPRFIYLKLGTNCGTAQAKNLGMVLGNYDAVTFHDSDDVAHSDKLLLQTRALNVDAYADDILDWAALDHRPNEAAKVDVAVGAHRFIKLDGSVHLISKRISLVDDFFPTLQGPSKTEGDWVLINSGLFRRECFEKLGGYLDSVEEDREIRNRLIASGYIFHFIEEPLLTKIEMESSLTTDADTGYRGEKRIADRNEVWRRNRAYRNGAWGQKATEIGRVAVDLPDLKIAEVWNGSSLSVNRDIPMTEGTAKNLEHQLDKARAFSEQANS